MRTIAEFKQALDETESALEKQDLSPDTVNRLQAARAVLRWALYGSRFMKKQHEPPTTTGKT